MAMTDAEYIRKQGQECPNCGRNDTTSKGPFNARGERLAVCWACSAEWREIHLFTRYEKIDGFK